jgi:hypothetical protein
MKFNPADRNALITAYKSMVAHDKELNTLEKQLRANRKAIFDEMKLLRQAWKNENYFQVAAAGESIKALVVARDSLNELLALKKTV